MKRVIIKTIVLMALFLFASGDAMAQFNLKKMTQKGSPSKFMRAHPDYIYLNKPEADNVTGFWYLISESLNPAALGLNSANYWIILESFDPDNKPKTLLWDGNIKQRLVKRMTTTSKKVVYFLNMNILDEMNLLTFVGWDEKYKFIIKCGLSGDGATYARGKWQKFTFQGELFSWITPDVKVELTLTPAQWLTDKLAKDKTHLNKCLQTPSTLIGTAGWFFDIKNNLESSFVQKYGLTYEPVIQLWKDEGLSIPLNFCKMAGTELTYHPDMNREEADFNNVIYLEKEFPSLTHQYYFLDWATFADVDDAETLPNGKILLKAYYSVRLNAKNNTHVKGHSVYDMAEFGSISLEAEVVNENQKQDNPNNTLKHRIDNRPPGPPNDSTGSLRPFIIPDPRPLCPPHKYEIVSEKEFLVKRVPKVISTPKSTLPQTINLNFGDQKVELRQQTADDQSICYITKNEVSIDLWTYFMHEFNGYISYNEALDFLDTVNEKAREASIPYSFTFPTFDEMKAYIKMHDDFNAYSPIFVDSVQMCDSKGEVISIEQYKKFINKSGVRLVGGCLEDKTKFVTVGMDEKPQEIVIFLKAIPDNQQMEVKKTSITRIGLMTTILRRCKKCGKTINEIKRSKYKTIQQMIEKLN